METTDAVAALSALAHAGRLDIFRLLVRRAPDAVPAGEIAKALRQQPTTVSNQLAQLEAAQLIGSERRGRSILYSARFDRAGALLAFLAAECCKGRPEVCAAAAAPFLRSPLEPKDADMTDAPNTDRRPYAVLFLCTHNSARSIFAEAILNRYSDGKFVAYSAGSQPAGEVNPRAVSLLDSLDYATAGLRSKSWSEFAGAEASSLDFVFTVCDNAANEPCPVWPGQPMTAHWGVPDPSSVEGAEAEVAVAFAEAYRHLYNRIRGFSSLPIASLDQLALQEKLDELGRLGPATPEAAGLASA